MSRMLNEELLCPCALGASIKSKIKLTHIVDIFFIFGLHLLVDNDVTQDLHLYAFITFISNMMPIPPRMLTS
jgi:hypothetical protein